MYLYNDDTPLHSNEEEELYAEQHSSSIFLVLKIVHYNIVSCTYVMTQTNKKLSLTFSGGKGRQSS